VNAVKTDNLPAGTYNIDAIDNADIDNTKAVLTGQYGFDPKPVGKHVLGEGTGAVTLVDSADTDANTKSGYYKKKTLTFRVGESETSVELSDTAFASAANLAADIQTKLRAKGGFWGDVTVTNDSGKLTLTKPSGALEEAKITAVNDDAKALFGSDSSVWTKDPGGATLKLEDQLGVTVAAPTKNANVLLEVTDVNTAAKSITMKVTANAIDAKGVTFTKTEEVTLTEGADTSILKDLLGDGKVKLKLENNMTSTFKKGNKIVVLCL